MHKTRAIISDLLHKFLGYTKTSKIMYIMGNPGDTVDYINLEESHINQTNPSRPILFGAAAHRLPAPSMRGAASPIV